MEINWLGVILAFAAGMVVAFSWYQDGFLGTQWKKLTNDSPERSKAAQIRNMIQLLIANGVTVIGLAFGIGIAEAATGGGSVWMALLVGFAVWLTFSATTLLQHNAFELKPAKLTAINIGYQLALFLTMSLVIGLL
jgi:hypothetical protein